MRRSSAPFVAAVLALAGMVGAAVSCTATDIPVLEASGDSGGATDGGIAVDGSPTCGVEGQPCCDAGCFEDGSFCSIDHSCHPAHPTDVGAPCTAGTDCQSGLCTYVQELDAGDEASAPSPTVCSEPCTGTGDCVPGWSCWTPAESPLVIDAGGPGTCVCTPVPETCDGKDDNCDGVIDEEPAASAACTALSGLPSTCVNGECTCLNRCAGVCVNLTDDDRNCGACGRTCISGLQVCASAECVCAGTLCPVPDGGVGDAGYLVPDGGPNGSPAACIDTASDPNNCGGCGIACAYTCDGSCTPLLLAALSMDADAAAEGFTPAGAIASDGTTVFILTAANGGVIEECSVGGCNQEPTTIATGLDNANNYGSSGLLALGGSWVYWPAQSAVEAVAPSGPTVSVFAGPANASLYAVATNATQVFWSDMNLGLSSCALGATCASPNTLVPIELLAAAPEALAADDDYLYWMDANGNVFSVPASGGAPVLLEAGDDAGVPGYPMAMVASADRVYFIDPENGRISSAIGGDASSSGVYAKHDVNALATDGTALYWATEAAVFKCALGTSCLTPTLIYAAVATSLAVDTAHLYWIDDGTTNADGVPRAWEFHK